MLASATALFCAVGSSVPPSAEPVCGLFRVVWPNGHRQIEDFVAPKARYGFMRNDRYGPKKPNASVTGYDELLTKNSLAELLTVCRPELRHATTAQVDVDWNCGSETAYRLATIFYIEGGRIAYASTLPLPIAD